MKATRSGIVIGLALALLLPGSAVGQEASPSMEPSPSSAASAVPSPAAVAFKSFYDLLDNDLDTLTAGGFRGAIVQAYGDEPDADAEAILSQDDALACVAIEGETRECDLMGRFWFIYRVTGDEAFFDLAVDAFNYGMAKNFGDIEGGKAQVREQLRTALGEEGPVPPEASLEVTASPSPQAAASPPVKVNLKKYSTAALFSKKPANIDKAGFRKVVKASAKPIAAYVQANISPDFTASVETKRLMGLWDIEKPGQRTNGGTGYEIAGYFHWHLEHAQKAAKMGDVEAANAFINVARALRRMHYSVTPPPSRKRDDFDRWAKQTAKDMGLD